ncbi:hypothetical protein [Methyloceanibacter caenitepidi]|uniref:Uncharacterized protein n=1 Tax=Methyloceanibacter caenitepidi TaxID=1384459 RepID=A0A0A8K6J2_9HYPH|nr:hypothetical protein [Methyloceanibacter caenitepidi]BAQ17624.1 hypothetical protein GL4_2181 [Methyloceanibacter caenitepidi]
MRSATENGTECFDPRLPAMTIALAFAGTLVFAVLVSAFFDSVGN